MGLQGGGNPLRAAGWTVRSVPWTATVSREPRASPNRPTVTPAQLTDICKLQVTIKLSRSDTCAGPVTQGSIAALVRLFIEADEGTPLFRTRSKSSLIYFTTRLFSAAVGISLSACQYGIENGQTFNGAASARSITFQGLTLNPNARVEVQALARLNEGAKDATAQWRTIGSAYSSSSPYDNGGRSYYTWLSQVNGIGSQYWPAGGLARLRILHNTNGSSGYMGYTFDDLDCLLEVPSETFQQRGGPLRQPRQWLYHAGRYRPDPCRLAALHQPERNAEPRAGLQSSSGARPPAQ